MPPAPSDERPPFWRENWPWILVPALVVLGLALYFVLSGSGDGGIGYGGW
jgi:hypothetical protein